MARILSFDGDGPSEFSENPGVIVWEWFNSLDRFVRLTIVIVFVLIISTPFIITSLYTFGQHAQAVDKLEPELGVISGNAVLAEDADASGGKYIVFQGFTSPPPTQTESNTSQTACPSVSTDTGRVIFSTTTTAGNYNVWSRIKTADSTNNSFYLKIDDACEVVVGDSSQIPTGAWTWVDYQNGSPSSKIKVNLAGGDHTITIIGREPGVEVDKILFTKDTSCTPTGTGDNCTAELPTPTPGSTSSGASSVIYGPGLASDALNNTRVGTSNGYKDDYRFKAKHSGKLTSFRPYIIWSTSKSGYHSGTGGTLLFELKTDDGSSEHRPSNNVIASVVHANPLDKGFFPLISFPSSANLTEGQIYHITVTNIDSDPVNNYVSMDHLYKYSAEDPMQPNSSDLDWAEMQSWTGSDWKVRRENTPILALYYSDGHTEGTGYMEVWVGAPKSISGTSSIREKFTVSGGDRNIDELNIRLRRVSGSDSLTYKVQAQSGSVVQQGTIPASSVTTATRPTWVKAVFESTKKLLNGQSYYLVFTAPSSTVYEAYPIRQGVSYGYPKTTYFSDGYAQYSQNGSTWYGWEQWGVNDRKEQDLQFYFTTAPVETPIPTTASTSSSTPTPLPTQAPTDITKPVISGVTTTTVTDTTATITWNLSEYATGQVEYGTTTSYGSKSAKETSFNWNYHLQTISNLTPGTTYHYRVISADASGNEAVSADHTFKTTGGINTPTPIPTTAPTNTITPTQVPQQTKDTTPPNIVITSPVNFSQIPRGELTIIGADVTDDGGIKYVEFYAGKKLLCRNYTWPYTCDWTVNANRLRLYDVKVEAFDYSNNSSSKSVWVYTGL